MCIHKWQDDSVTTETAVGLLIPTKFCSKMNTNNYTRCGLCNLHSPGKVGYIYDCLVIVYDLCFVLNVKNIAYYLCTLPH